MNKKNVFTCVYLGIIVLTLFLNTFFISIIKVCGNSMLPTLEDGDYVLVLKTQNINRGDVVIINDGKGKYIVKRVAGIAGDEILITAHETYVNDILFDNLTNSLQTDYREYIHVPSESIYILGDNRLESFDSRDIGYISKEMVKGKIIFS